MHAAGFLSCKWGSCLAATGIHGVAIAAKPPTATGRPAATTPNVAGTPSGTRSQPFSLIVEGCNPRSTCAFRTFSRVYSAMLPRMIAEKTLEMDPTERYLDLLKGCLTRTLDGFGGSLRSGPAASGELEALGFRAGPSLPGAPGHAGDPSRPVQRDRAGGGPANGLPRPRR
jgi:hypothetical protein